MAGISVGDYELQRLFYTSVADRDPMAQNAYEYVNSFSYAGVTYGKTATVLLTLEGIIGETHLCSIWPASAWETTNCNGCFIRALPIGIPWPKTPMST